RGWRDLTLWWSLPSKKPTRALPSGMRYSQNELLPPFSTIRGPPLISVGFTQADKVNVVSLRLGLSRTKMWLEPSKLPTSIAPSQTNSTPEGIPWFFVPLLSAVDRVKGYHATKPSHFG